MGTNVTTAFITSPQNPNETLGIKLPFLVMIIKNVRCSLGSSKNILLSRFRCLTTKTYAGGSELPTTSLQLESNLLSVLCRWDSTRAGTRFSLTYQISPGGPTAAIILRLWEWRSMRIAASEGFTFRIGCIVSRSCLQNSSCSCPSKNSSEMMRFVYYIDFGDMICPLDNSVIFKN